ncbi:glycosyltransferase [Stieleria sp. ICT_E10.1]|uniref:glycosyltransferase n=1 Tax=Stieleria sedimenti TaxID=2976331 RepID=UPI0021807F13|nr:glycosyltransferase [Stieleria sedimenti]MCS7465774.1 glycosyltransferase [Stieleria sedimenti]
MNIVFLTHPDWMQSSSMPRLARMFGEGMKSKGHRVSYWTSKPCLGRFAKRSGSLRKWLGYLDQYLIYPWSLAKNVRNQPDGTVFVVTDQALGIWVPKITHRPHVIHCNDFLALRSALDQFPENPTKWSGKVYQHFIRRGFSRGSHFVSISNATNRDLQRLTLRPPLSAEAVHLGLNGDFRVLDDRTSKEILKSKLRGEEATGFLLHVGGSQWYKNRGGVIALYRAWASRTERPMPLWMVGTEPEESLRVAARDIPNGGTVRFLAGCSNEEVIAAYNLASLFLFPSLEEGFGWPIAEALACGTLVLTTDAAPMTEVGGDAASYFRRWSAVDKTWASDGAELIDSLLSLSQREREKRVQRGLEHAGKFTTKTALDAYEEIYERVVKSWSVETEAIR